jgi:hypothetical protein
MWLITLHRRSSAADARAMAEDTANGRDRLRPSTLAHHAQRLDLVLRELRKRARPQAAPRLVGRTLEGLEAELAAVRRQLTRR